MGTNTTIEDAGKRFGEIARAAGNRSQEIERLRQLPTDLVADMAASGIFKLTVASDYGGAQTSMQNVLDAIELVSYHDGSAGWCVMIANTTATLSGWMEPTWASKIFGPDDAVSGGHAAPNGIAQVVDGGLNVTGKWEWGSGSSHVTAMGGGVRVVGDDGKRATSASGASIMLAFFDDADVELLDTWYVAGMKGTASTDYQVTEAFVPEGRWADTAPLHDGAPRIDDVLYRFPFYGNFALSVAAVQLGLARRAVDEVVALGQKLPAGSRRPLADKSTARAALSDADAAVRMARAFVADVVGQTSEAAANNEVTIEHKRLVRLAASTVSERCGFAIRTCFETAGGTAVYDASPLQRLQRDSIVAAQHAMIGRTQLERTGAVQFGADVDIRGF